MEKFIWLFLKIFSFYFYSEWLALTGSLQFFYLALQICCSAHAEAGSRLNYLLPELLNLLNDNVLWKIPARKTGNSAHELNPN